MPTWSSIDPMIYNNIIYTISGTSNCRWEESARSLIDFVIRIRQSMFEKWEKLSLLQKSLVVFHCSCHLDITQCWILVDKSKDHPHSLYIFRGASNPYCALYKYEVLPEVVYHKNYRPSPWRYNRSCYATIQSRPKCQSVANKRVWSSINTYKFVHATFGNEPCPVRVCACGNCHISAHNAVWLIKCCPYTGTCIVCKPFDKRGLCRYCSHWLCGARSDFINVSVASNCFWTHQV